MHALRTAKRMGAFHPAMTPVVSEGGGEEPTEADDVYGADLVLWLYGSNATASQWTDASGQGNHVVQATEANQPVPGTGGQNGHAFVTFDGSNDYYALATGFAGMPAGSGFTSFIVAKPTNTGNTLLNLENASNTNLSQQRIITGALHTCNIVLDNGGAAQTRTGGTATVAVSTTEPSIIECGIVVATPAMSRAVNGADQTTGTTADGSVTHAAVDGAIVGNNIALSQPIAGDFYEIIIAKTSDLTKRATMLAALGVKYAITLP